MIIADADDYGDDQPEPINIGVSFALVLVSKGVKGGDIHTRNLCNFMRIFLKNISMRQRIAKAIR